MHAHTAASNQLLCANPTRGGGGRLKCRKGDSHSLILPQLLKRRCSELGQPSSPTHALFIPAWEAGLVPLPLVSLPCQGLISRLSESSSKSRQMCSCRDMSQAGKAQGAVSIPAPTGALPLGTFPFNYLAKAWRFECCSMMAGAAGGRLFP